MRCSRLQSDVMEEEPGGAEGGGASSGQRRRRPSGVSRCDKEQLTGTCHAQRRVDGAELTAAEGPPPRQPEPSRECDGAPRWDVEGLCPPAGLLKERGLRFGALKVDPALQERLDLECSTNPRGKRRTCTCVQVRRD